MSSADPARRSTRSLLVRSAAALVACALMVWGAVSGCSSGPPIRAVDRLDLEAFMGTWCVIAHIPTSVEEGSYMATETYALRDDGVVDITFRFREGGFDGEEEVIESTGYVEDDGSGARWRVQFFWPIRLEYVVVWLSEDRSSVLIGRTDRDYAWIMAREPRMDPAHYDRALEVMVEEGYDLSGLRRVPWPDAASGAEAASASASDDAPAPDA